MRFPVWKQKVALSFFVQNSKAEKSILTIDGNFDFTREEGISYKIGQKLINHFSSFNFAPNTVHNFYLTFHNSTEAH